MVSNTLASNLASLYNADETAWLDEMARLAAEGDVDQLDLVHLSEYLTDMATRDRREVVSRLAVLLCHRLKWDNQPDQRSGSWERTIRTQRRELGEILESAVLRAHAVDQLSKAYTWAVDDAVSETGMTRETFPESCPYSLEAALGE